jgi:hypothetical protein
MMAETSARLGDGETGAGSALADEYKKRRSKTRKRQTNGDGNDLGMGYKANPVGGRGAAQKQ